MDAAIEAVELRKTYPPDVRALDGVSIAVPEATIFGLLGPNGAGKSTTVRVLCTLTRPDGGTARVAGIDVRAEPLRVRRAIGVVGQKHGADPEATARENLVLQGEFHGLTGLDLRRRAGAALERFDLVEAADRPVKTLSGGMARKLDIAMGLLHRPRVLFLDEPTTGLDPEARAELWREIERLAADERITILLTTHHMEEADKLASQLAIIDRGRVVASGTPDDLKATLEGDAIQIQLADRENGAARAALDSIGGLDEVELEGRMLRARARDGGAAIPALLAALEVRGVKALSVTLARPSLDDVYLRYAGRSFRRADAELAEVVA
ncbi:MAG: ATP-binding cassette domain-containing protein [Solirubrobacteraceae bacterium]